MSVTVKSLKKENDSLKEQINALSKDFDRLRSKLQRNEAQTENGQGRQVGSPNEEIRNNLEFYSKSYDDLTSSQKKSTVELQQFKNRLDILSDKVENISAAIEESQQYSYRYNVKLMGIPDNNPSESASETTNLCLKLVQKLGVEITRNDIDIAHRVKKCKAQPTADYL
jgi:chromosome segregation ATPase